jgi:TrmH family RNA methyltransferase
MLIMTHKVSRCLRRRDTRSFSGANNDDDDRADDDDPGDDLDRSSNNHHHSSTSTILSSLKSTTVKKMQALVTKSKKRMEYGQTVVEGPRIIFDLLRNPQTQPLVQQVLVSTAHMEYVPQLEQLQQEIMMQHQLQQQEVIPPFRIQLGTPQVVQACCDTVTSQGMVATVNLPPFYYYNSHPNKNNDGETILSKVLRPNYYHHNNEQEDSNRINEARHCPSSSIVLILDGLSDPGNLGTLLRTSVAVGVAAVLLLPQCCDPYQPKALRSAMGTTFLVPILSFDSWTACYEQLMLFSSSQQQQQQQDALKIWAATMIDDDHDDDDKAATDHTNNDASSNTPTTLPSMPYYQIDWTSSSSSSSTLQALVIGGEGNGLSLPIRQALAHGTIRAVHVPMQTGIESLNAAVCGSVILFEAYRQQQQQQQEQEQQRVKSD